MMDRRTSDLKQILVTVLLAAALFGPLAGVWAQDEQATEVAPPPTPTPAPTPIPAAEIPDRAAMVGSLLRGAIASTDVAEDVEKIAQEFGTEQEHLADLSDETNRRLEAGGPASIIEEAQNAWQRSGNRLEGWMGALKAHSTTIADQRKALEEERQLWQLTLASADEVELPEALHQQVLDTLSAISDAEARVRANRDAVLTLQSAVAREKAALEEMLATQQDEIDRRRRGIIGLDSPPIWAVFRATGIEGAPSEQVVSMWSKSVESIREYVSEQSDRILRQILFLVMFLVAVLYLRRRAVLWAQQDRSLQRTVNILDRPLAAAFIVTVLLSEVFYPNAPRAWLDFVGLFLLLALLRLLPRLLPQSMRSGAYLLALLYFLHKIMDLAPEGNLVNRLALFAVSVTGAASCRWLSERLRGLGEDISGGWMSAMVVGARLTFAAFSVAAIANVVGAVGLAIVIVEGVLSSIYGAILVWVAAVFSRALVRVALLTPAARKFGLVRLHADTVRASLFQLIRLLAIVLWAVMTLEGIEVFGDVRRGARRALESEISIGDFSVFPADILIFAVVVWLAFKISQLLRFVLDTDVLPHMDLPRGVPAAINRLSHYAVVVVGVMIAATAAGLDFSRINLIVGALGVGIGFGLQNVVNNFVSGLILLFERPIRVGDKIQLADLFGTVENIGMRASIVRTLQGAEVIVPNANLISAEVVNWTLSDERRRADIPVGVAYGTDPQAVIDLLIGLAADHPEVMDDPAPEAFFLGFGASSLDFELRAWTRASFIQVASDLRVRITEALEEVGIEIPFPQRDLHLRSVDTEAAKMLNPRDSGNSKKASD
jgi:small-conductance mechanosensitive channel